MGSFNFGSSGQPRWNSRFAVLLLLAAQAPSPWLHAATGAENPNCNDHFKGLREESEETSSRPAALVTTNDAGAAAQERAWDSDRQNHNQLLGKKAEGLSPSELHFEIERLVAGRAKLDPGFAARDFSDYLNAQPELLTPGRRAGTLGEILDQAYRKFEPDQAVRLAKAKVELEDQVQAVVRLPENENLKCQSAKCTSGELTRLTRFIQDKFRKSCYARNPVTIRQFAENMAFLYAGYAYLTATKPGAGLSDYPWEYAISSLLWGALFGEIGCRNTFGSTGNPGLEIPPRRPSVGERLALFGRKTLKQQVSYMKWMPLSAASTVGLAMGADYLRGQTEDKTADFYVKRLAFQSSYSTAVDPLKRVLVLDPSYNLLFPALEKGIQGLVRNRLLGGVIWIPLSVAGRYALTTADSKGFFTASDAFNRRFGGPSGKPGVPPKLTPAQNAEALRKLADEINQEEAVYRRMP